MTSVDVHFPLPPFYTPPQPVTFSLGGSLGEKE
jgi:hypothetical protein